MALLLLLLATFTSQLRSMTFEEKYEVWSADLKPGYTIQKFQLNGRACHCKIPNTTTLAPDTTPTTPTSPTTSVTSFSQSSSVFGFHIIVAASHKPKNIDIDLGMATGEEAAEEMSNILRGVITNETKILKETRSGVFTSRAVCNQTMTINGTMTKEWMSPNFPENYPDDVTCHLTIQFTIPSGYLTIKFDESSKLHESAGCENDYLIYINNGNTGTRFCQNIHKNVFAEVNAADVPKILQFIFITSSADGHKVEKGFKMMVEGIDVNASK